MRMHARTGGLALALAASAACRLDPLVEDTPGASVNVLPSDATVRNVTTNPELTNQITLNDSLARVFGNAGGTGLIPRSSGGWAGGNAVAFWSFGTAERAPAPIYLFGTGDPNPEAASFVLNDHLPLVDALPGDSEYEPVHTIYNVQVTDKYRGEKITTTAALADAIDLGLVNPPVATKRFYNWPIVRPGTTLDVGGGMVASPRPIYGRGYLVDSYRLGAQQSNPLGLLPTAQVSFLREPGSGGYDQVHPIFQALPMTAGYTPVSIVVNVDLAQGTGVADIHGDADLFTRTSTGAIMMPTNKVANFLVTETTLDLQIQFTEGAP